MVKERRFPGLLVFLALVFFLYPDAVTGQGVAEILASGEKAVELKKFAEAEKHFSQAVDLEPKNYKALHGLAQVKVELKNFPEALPLLDRILAMPEATGRNILIHLPGEEEPQEGEVVDETVMKVDPLAESERGELSKFQKKSIPKPVPHYRVYLKKSGKMKLFPKSRIRIEYSGIPTATRELVLKMKTEVQKSIISSAPQTRPEEEMVAIPAGCFLMGHDGGFPDEQPAHEVCLSAYTIGKYEVRQKNFQALMQANPSEHVGPDLPVDSVTWSEARDYCARLEMRLPTEAQWEFAARGGTTTDFYWGDAVSGKNANFCDSACVLNIRMSETDDGFKHSAPVGSFAANPYGLHDMAGNVNEWVRDWMVSGYYLISPKQDPPGPRSELDACMREDCVGSFSITQKVYRGGGWNQQPMEMRSANRGDAHIQLRSDGIGFRCAGS